MPKGYLVARADVTNLEKWMLYVEKSKLALDKFGGKPLARGGRYEIIEGAGTPRNVVIEFPSFDDALGYVRSPEYAAAKSLRDGAGIMNMTILEGL